MREGQGGDLISSKFCLNIRPLDPADSQARQNSGARKHIQLLAASYF